MITTEIKIINIEPVTTGKSIYSKETSPNKAINGLAAAGGWTTLKYIINVKVSPTDKPSVINETPKKLLNSIPIIIPNKWPKNIFPGWANSLSCNTKTIRVVAPKDIIKK